APLADWRSVAITVAALLAQILLLERAGFIISSTILFAGVAWAFGSRRHGRDVVIGFILAFVVYWSFTQWLGLRLPAGILRPVLVGWEALDLETLSLLLDGFAIALTWQNLLWALVGVT